ncbi:multi-sensor hybrid histidine kinase [Stanieria sp. NIES-3757]|nr:multi-sensor hybrid histidine kinase [Stanieria sp. NIES-3757]
MLQNYINILAMTRFIPHGHCYLWKSNLVGLHITSDLLIAIAYYSIPIALLYFVFKRSDLPYPRIFVLFAAFIICCGTTHVMGIWTLWHPNYWVSGLIKAITAIVSIDTACEIIPLIPQALALPSPAQLEVVNQQLEQEIIKHQQTEKALQESEERYRRIVEDQTELISRFKSNGTLTFVNDAYCRYFGQKKEDVIAKSYQPVVFPEDQPKIDELLNSLTYDNPVGKVENRVIVNGEIRWTQWINRMIFDEQGNFLEFQSVGRDITEQQAVLHERKKIAEALQRRESILRSFYHNASMMMGIVKLVDEQIVPISYNNTAANFFELLPETGNEQSTSQIVIFSQVMGEWIKSYQKNELTGNSYCFEYVHQTDTNFIYLSVTISLIQELSLEDLWFSYIAEDITERKQTRAIQQKEILIKELHHRVKNNLQIICSLLNLQSRLVQEPTIIDKFKEIQNRILTISLVHEQLYQSENISQINLAEYIPALANNLFRCYILESQKVNLIIDIKQNFLLDLDTVIPCGLIINELISNALKYAFDTGDKGEILIKVTADGAGNLILSIQDNGKGLPNDLKIEKSKTLGLKLVKNLINQLRGQMEINTDIGTRFTMILTRIKNNSAAWEQVM